MRQFRPGVMCAVRALIAMAVMLISGTGAMASQWAIDKSASTLGFRAKQEGGAFEGVFENWSAEIVLDPADLSGARIHAVIDLSSAKTGDRARDQALPGNDWFDVKTKTEAEFLAEKIVYADADGTNIATGTLSLRDGVKPVMLPFTLKIDGDTARAVGETVLHRTDFGVGQGAFATDEWVGLNVTVFVDITASR